MTIFPYPSESMYPPNKGPDNFVLALQWADTFARGKQLTCKRRENVCTRNHKKFRFFAIHGLWPLKQAKNVKDTDLKELEKAYQSSPFSAFLQAPQSSLQVPQSSQNSQAAKKSSRRTFVVPQLSQAFLNCLIERFRYFWVDLMDCEGKQAQKKFLEKQWTKHGYYSGLPPDAYFDLVEKLWVGIAKLEDNLGIPVGPQPNQTAKEIIQTVKDQLKKLKLGIVDVGKGVNVDVDVGKDVIVDCNVVRDETGRLLLKEVRICIAIIWDKDKDGKDIIKFELTDARREMSGIDDPDLTSQIILPVDI